MTHTVRALIIAILVAPLALCHGAELAKSELWTEFVRAKRTGEEPPLPDYSYAGYALGAQGAPAVKGKRFDVTDFGAIPNDMLSDRVAIEKAIQAADANGGGIVFFPPGLFLVNEEVGARFGIQIQGAQIALKGSGCGPGGTEIFMRRNLMPKDPERKYSVPYMFEFKTDKRINRKVTTVTRDAVRESFSIVVADAEALEPGMLLELSMSSPDANAEFLDGLKTWDIWKEINDKGVTVRGERHRINGIEGERIILDEPIHCNILARHGWTVSTSTLVAGWVVEDIHFRGNWKEKFVHHKDYVHDSGWRFLSFTYGDSPILRRCRFTDSSAAAAMGACYAGTILNCSIEGNQGHTSFASEYFSYGTLMAFCADTVANGTFHGFGANAGSVGTVITYCKNSDRGFDWHGSFPYCTLIDACSGGLIGNGGSIANLPNHMRYLTIWNFNQTAGNVYQKYDWWKPRKNSEQYSGAKVAKPIIVGYHGLETTFKPESCKLVESHGTPVAPPSLYVAQLEARLGARPAWIDQAQAGYAFFMENGYWTAVK